MLPPSLRSQEPVMFLLGASFKLNWGVKAMCSRVQQEGAAEHCSSSVTKPSPPMSPVGEEGPLKSPHVQVMSYDTLLFGKH